MFVWRLASRRYPPLSGEGARLVGGRWNSPGHPLVYASESLALCLADEELRLRTLKAGWEHDLARTRAIGDKWLRQQRSLALIVPSAVLPDSKNILLNPQHPDSLQLRLISQQPFTFDPRLRPAR